MTTPALLLSILFLLTACASPAGTTSPPQAPPSATPEFAVTVIPPADSPTPPPSGPTETATPPGLPPDTPAPTPEPPCTNEARFVADLTIPDGKQYLPGQAEAKRWQVQNAGSCDWGPDFRLMLVSGNPLGAAPEQALYPALAGRDGFWEIVITAPNEPGIYTSRWRARDPQGRFFGDVVFVKIEVISLPTPVP